MDEEHTRETTIIFLQAIVFVYLVLYIFQCATVFNAFKLSIILFINLCLCVSLYIPLCIQVILIFIAA